MTTEMLRFLMEQLLREGVNNVRMIHFEGRGDPLVNPNLGDLITMSKRYFPSSISMVTTHASYPYKSWLTSCPLDILRVSIDGAFADSYVKYRVGGNLEKALTFLRTLRDERRLSISPIKVIWKYILFEWNDSDEELQQAGLLATELNCGLQFVLTHTPGRSIRFTDHTLFREHLRKINVAASVERTYQIKPAIPGAEVEGTGAEYVETVLRAALEYAQGNDVHNAVSQVICALTHDPGLSSIEDHGQGIIRAYLNEILSNARFPLTLTWLAAISRQWGEMETSVLLLQRYLELAPNAPEREHVLQHLASQQSAQPCSRLAESLSSSRARYFSVLAPLKPMSKALDPDREVHTAARPVGGRTSNSGDSRVRRLRAAVSVCGRSASVRLHRVWCRTLRFVFSRAAAAVTRAPAGQTQAEHG
jgi:hypothetical protein